MGHISGRPPTTHVLRGLGVDIRVESGVTSTYTTARRAAAATRITPRNALTYREFRDNHSEPEESFYDFFLRYNRIA
jgi:hypothetical protein